MLKNNFFKTFVEIIKLWNNPNYEAKTDFIKTAISDTQDTIRAIDIKVEIVLGILVLVATGVFTNLPDRSYLWLVGIIMLSFILSVILGIRTLITINNPENNICVDKTEHSDICGLFYGDSYISDGKVNYNKFIVDINSKSERDLLNELIFDFNKLIYIRHQKIKRQSCAFLSAIITISLYTVLLLLQYGNKCIVLATIH